MGHSRYLTAGDLAARLHDRLLLDAIHDTSTSLFRNFMNEKVFLVFFFLEQGSMPLAYFLIGLACFSLGKSQAADVGW